MLRQESKSGLEASLVSSGHAYASTRLSADHSLAGALGEATGGVSMLESVKANLAMAENDFPKLQVLAPFSSVLLSKENAEVLLVWLFLRTHDSFSEIYFMMPNQSRIQTISQPLTINQQARLEAMRSRLLSKTGALINLSADANTLTSTQPAVEAFVNALPEAPANEEVKERALEFIRFLKNEGVVLSLAISMF